MDYEYGDILDARNDSSIEHFILIVGEVTKNGNTEVMYYIITSRVYAVFKDILSYFNDCLARKDVNFIKYFNKERGKKSISPYGSLCHAVFFDKQTRYNSCFDVDSMVVVNSDPLLIDKSALDALIKSKVILYKTRLSKPDAYLLRHSITFSDDVSQTRKHNIAENFNRIKQGLVS